MFSRVQISFEWLFYLVFYDDIIDFRIISRGSQ